MPESMESASQKTAPVRDGRWIAALATGWVVVTALVGLGGDYSLNDDWCYLWSARKLALHGQLRILDLVAPVPILPTLWGAAVLRLADTAVALRAAVESWALIGVLLLYGIGRRGKLPPAQSALLAATVGLSPWYVNLALCFMTDIPMLVCLWAAIYLLLPSAAGRVRTRALFGAGCMVALAYLTRQFGILLAPAACMLIWLRDTAARTSLGKRLLRVGTFVAPTSVAVAASTHWYYEIHGQTVANRGTVMRMGSQVQSLAHGMAGWHYLGLWALPWVLAVLANRDTRAKLPWRKLLLLTLPLVGYSLYAYRAYAGPPAVAFDVDLPPLMPYLGNLVYSVGVGVLTLPDAFRHHVPFLHESVALRWALSGITCVAGAFAGLWLGRACRLSGTAVVACLQRQAPDAAAQTRLLFMLFAATYATFMLLASSLLFDRYLLPLMPVAIFCILDACPPAVARSRVVLAGVALMGVFSVGANHEYMSWNDARATAVHNLQAQGVPIRDIDGGYEYNGTWRFESFFNNFRGLFDDPFLFWARGTRYHVTQSPTPPPEIFHAERCEAVASVPYWTWPGTGPAAVHVVDCGPQPPAPRGYNP